MLIAGLQARRDGVNEPQRRDTRPLRCRARRRADIAHARSSVYVTSIDMAGASITVSMLDDEAKALWDAPVRTAAPRLAGFERRRGVRGLGIGSCEN
jgi:hypothetical protein